MFNRNPHGPSVKSPKFKQFGIDRTIELNSLDEGIGIRGC